MWKGKVVETVAAARVLGLLVPGLWRLLRGLLWASRSPPLGSLSKVKGQINASTPSSELEDKDFDECRLK